MALNLPMAEGYLGNIHNPAQRCHIARCVHGVAIALHACLTTIAQRMELSHVLAILFIGFNTFSPIKRVYERIRLIQHHSFSVSLLKFINCSTATALLKYMSVSVRIDR